MTIYLDTSVLSALFDARNPERAGITKEFFAARVVRRKTRDVVNMVNTLEGYPHIEIAAPGELL